MNDETEQRKTLYVFIDESGNFDFSPKGSKYFILTGFVTFDPVVRREQLIKLRYSILTDGYNHEYFHATEDKQFIRDQVFALLENLGSTYEVHTVVAQKNKTHPSLYTETYIKKGKTITLNTGMGLYQTVCGCLLQYIFRGKGGRVDNIVVVLGSLYQGDKKHAILKTLKRYPKQHFTGVPFEIYSHQTCVDLNCQLADYCCWAMSAKYERGEERPYQVIEPQIESVFDIFRNGGTTHYEYR